MPCRYAAQAPLPKFCKSLHLCIITPIQTTGGHNCLIPICRPLGSNLAPVLGKEADTKQPSKEIS